MILDAVTRLLPGALGNEDSTVNESFSSPANWDELQRTVASLAGSETLTRGVAPAPSVASQSPGGDALASRGILDYPHYTRPPSFRGWDVPEILLSGNHEEIRRWRLREAIAKTSRNRPDLLAAAGREVERRDG
jgi:tRNA (guanine37-N1)-methyltransferase